MEQEPHRGAGPETTANEHEQAPRIVPEQPAGPRDADMPEAARAQRRHDLGARPDRLHTRGHPGVRGDRLEIDCARQRWPWGGGRDGI